MVPAGLTNPAGATRHEGGSSVVLGWTAPPGSTRGRQSRLDRSGLRPPLRERAPRTGPSRGLSPMRREPGPDPARQVSLRRAEPAFDQLVSDELPEGGFLFLG